jgi:hypothetical protein
MLPGSGRHIPATFADGGIAPGGLGLSGSSSGAYAGTHYGPNATSGGMNLEQKVFVVHDTGEAFRRGFNENKDMMINVMAQNARAGGSVRRALSRPG